MGLVVLEGLVGLVELWDFGTGEIGGTESLKPQDPSIIEKQNNLKSLVACLRWVRKSTPSLFKGKVGVDCRSRLFSQTSK